MASNPLSKAEPDERSLAEKALMEWGVTYEKKPNGAIFVPFDLYIADKGLIALPDLSSVSVGRGFYCHKNKLTSLKGAPAAVGGNFVCSGNQLTSLEHTSTSFQRLVSDFGDFLSWDEVPHHLAPETKARMEQEWKVQAEVAIYKSTMLQDDVPIKAPLKIRKNPAPRQ